MNTLIGLISSKTKASPQAVAAGFAGDTLTYSELEARVDSFAHAIAARDFPENTLIAVMMERSLNMLIALLGVMKAGHAYLPIDPSFPRDRIDYMLEHSQVQAIVIDASILKASPAFDFSRQVNLQVIDFSTLQLVLDAEPFPARTQANGLAYVIYTSGSTGRPKGVMVTHANVSNFLLSMAKEPGFNHEDRLLAITTLSFDISVLELYLPLTLGGYVEIIDKQTASDGQAIAKVLEQQTITVMQATPSTWKMMFDAGWQGRSDLKVLIGGEAPPKEVVSRLIQSCKSVWNMYGPTETTVWSSCAKITDANSISLGTAIDNTQLYVLNENLQPVTPGTEGLLYIGGAGLARGYLFQEELTSERFVSAECADGNLIYNTGDIVCEREDGLLEYRRRADNQIKLRGFRIELGEIEIRLNAISGVTQSVVTVIEDKDDKQLVAYLVKDQAVADSALTVKGLRHSLKQNLPDYMIPNRYALVEALPLTPNGKVDRHNLPPFYSLEPLLDENYIAPRNEIETAIAEIWQEVLGIKKVSVTANFFDLGGHSLLITRIWTRLKKRLEMEIPLNKMFESPTIAELTKSLEKLGNLEAHTKSISRISRMKAPLMSLAQQRFWYINEIAENDAFYNLCSAFRIEGDLDIDRLEHTLNAIVERHEIMRTALVWTGEQPQQVISKVLKVKIPQDDFSHLSGSKQQTKLMEHLQKQVMAKIPLDQAPLFRVSLTKLDSRNHVLFFMPHHVIWDGWCFDIFLRELKIIYEAFTLGQEPELEAMNIQYADFSHWNIDYLSSDALEGQLEYWKKQLEGELPILDLPLDYTRPAEYSYRGATMPIQFSDDSVAAINRLAVECNSTVNMVLMTIYFILLHRYTGQGDIIIGSPIQGRLLPETENMIGLFVNTLALRINLAGAPTFVDLLNQVRKVALEAYQNQEIPFERLVETVVIERDISRTPIFQALFTFQEVRERNKQIGDLTLHQINLHNESCPTELSFWVKSSPNGISGAVEYNPDLFSQKRIERLIEHIKHLTINATESPQMQITKLPIMPNEELNRLVNGYNETVAKIPQSVTVAELIEKQAQKQPDSLAIKNSQAVLTYAELVDKSNTIAGHLIREGVQPGQLVAVCMERNLDMPVVLLAIWKCGAAYLPIDPDFPSDRVKYILEHSKATFIITQSHLQDTLQKEAHILLLEQLQMEGEANSIQVEVTPEMPAYVIYTSGSTGFPKGVVTPHRAVVNFLNSMAKKPGLNNDDKVLAITTLSFDIHVLEIWLPLIVGAQVFIASTEQSRSGDTLSTLLEEENISLMQATPSTWNLLLGFGWTGKANLKALIGGEASSRELIDSLLTRVKTLWNMYGPTETTVWSTCHRIEKSDSQIMIGWAIDNTQLYVLDKSLQVVPHGIEGELYIGGIGLSTGYLHDDKKTQEVFIDVDLPQEKTERLYKTGDLVVVNETGSLRYLRRLDNQVKVRGFRIELGEIESAIADFDEVSEVVVVVREDMPGDKRIVAYFVSQDEASMTVTEMREKLKNRLPAYMMPQYLVNLPALPLTPNGKIDRKALPTPYEIYSDINQEKAKPEGETELLIAKIWKQLVQFEGIGRNDNFFEIGGHSLLSMQFINEIRLSLGASITPRDVVLNNLTQLAKIIDESIAKQSDNSAPKPVKDKQKTKLLGRFISRFK